MVNVRSGGPPSEPRPQARGSPPRSDASAPRSTADAGDRPIRRPPRPASPQQSASAKRPPELSGHLRSTHFPIAQPVKERANRTGGLHRMDTQLRVAASFSRRSNKPESVSDRADLQLVKPVCAPGRSRSPSRGDHQRAASSARDRPPDPACRSNPADGDVEPRAAAGGCRGLATDRRLLPEPDAKCGAVERRGSLAPGTGGGAEEAPAWPPARPTALAPAPSARAHGLKSTQKTARPQPATAAFRINYPRFWMITDRRDGFTPARVLRSFPSVTHSPEYAP